MKNSLKLCFVAMLMFSTSCSTEPTTEFVNNDRDVGELPAVDNPSSETKSDDSKSPIYNPINNMEKVGTSILHRTNNMVSVNFRTTDLEPGYAYTLWWVIWNNPQECAMPNECTESDFAKAEAVGVEVLYATGLVADDSGIGNFSASLDVDDDSESVNELFELPHRGGLESGKAFTSEIHLVLRSHGPVIPELVDEQIGGYLGGCSVFLGTFNEIPDEVGECGDIEFSIHAPIGG